MATFIFALNRAIEEYDKMRAASPAELPKCISSYLNCIAYMYHFAPFATVYDGKAQSLPDARKTSTALNILEKKRGIYHLSYKDVVEIKESVAALFDGVAIQKAFEENSSHIFKISFLMMQVYRMLYPFQFIKYLKRKEETGHFYEIIRHALHLPTRITDTQIQNSMNLIDNLRGYCRVNNVRNFGEILSYIYTLRAKYSY